MKFGAAQLINRSWCGSSVKYSICKVLHFLIRWQRRWSPPPGFHSFELISDPLAVTDTLHRQLFTRLELPWDTTEPTLSFYRYGNQKAAQMQCHRSDPNRSAINSNLNSFPATTTKVSTPLCTELSTSPASGQISNHRGLFLPLPLHLLILLITPRNLTHKRGAVRPP